MVPKYTIKLDLQKATSALDDVKNNTCTKQDIESVLIDADYNSMKLLQSQMEDALRSIKGRYSKKVFKFLK